MQILLHNITKKKVGRTTTQRIVEDGGIKYVTFMSGNYDLK